MSSNDFFNILSRQNKTENPFSLQDDETIDNIIEPYGLIMNSKEPYLLSITSNLLQKTHILLHKVKINNNKQPSRTCKKS